MIPTVRIITPVTDDNPLGFVVINADDFDSAFHELFDKAPSEQAKLSAAQLRGELTARGIEFDPNAKKFDLQALLDAAPAQ